MSRLTPAPCPEYSRALATRGTVREPLSSVHRCVSVRDDGHLQARRCICIRCRLPATTALLFSGPPGRGGARSPGGSSPGPRPPSGRAASARFRPATIGRSVIVLSRMTSRSSGTPTGRDSSHRRIGSEGTRQQGSGSTVLILNVPLHDARYILRRERIRVVVFRRWYRLTCARRMLQGRERHSSRESA